MWYSYSILIFCLKESIVLNCNQRLGALALCSLAVLAMAGCQPQQKIVATVNSTTIGEDDYVDRLQTASQLVPQLDAGGTTLIYMIREELTHQLTKRNKTPVTDEQVSHAVN